MMLHRSLAGLVLLVGAVALAQAPASNVGPSAQAAPANPAAAKAAPTKLPPEPPPPPSAEPRPVIPEEPTGPVSVTLPAKLPASPGFFRVDTKVNIGQKQFPMTFGLFVPQAYFSSDKRFPLVVALHNRGLEGTGGGPLDCEGIVSLWTRGNWDNRDRHHAPTTQAVDLRRPGAFIGLAPQAPYGRAMHIAPMPQVLAAAMDAFSAAFRIDTDRTYLTGFSFGGTEVWAIGEQMPERFAALAPYAGRATADPAKTAAVLARVPVYIGSGELDTFFSGQCQIMYKALLAAGHSDVVYKPISAGNHFSYCVIYTDPQFWDWMFSKRISQRPATQPVSTTKLAL